MPPWAPPAAPAPPAPLNIFKSIRLLMESPPAPLSIIRGRRLFIPPIIPPAAEPDLARLRRCSNILFRAFWAAAAAEEDSAGLLPVAAANYRRKKKVLSAKAKLKGAIWLVSSKKESAKNDDFNINFFWVVMMNMKIWWFNLFNFKKINAMTVIVIKEWWDNDLNETLIMKYWKRIPNSPHI